jgi:hypothetical protein
MEDRQRFEEVKKAESVSTMIQNARRVLKEELHEHTRHGLLVTMISGLELQERRGVADR